MKYFIKDPHEATKDENKEIIRQIYERKIIPPSYKVEFFLGELNNCIICTDVGFLYYRMLDETSTPEIFNHPLNIILNYYFEEGTSFKQVRIFTTYDDSFLISSLVWTDITDYEFMSLCNYFERHKIKRINVTLDTGEVDNKIQSENSSQNPSGSHDSNQPPNDSFKKLTEFKIPFYLQTVVIAVLFFFRETTVTPLLGIILMALQYAKFSEYRSLTKNNIEKLNDIEEEYVKRLKVIEAKEFSSKFREIRLENNYNIKKTQLEQKLKGETKDLENYIAELKEQLFGLSHRSVTDSYKFSEYDALTSQECKNQISLLKQEEMKILKEDFTVAPDTTQKKQEIMRNQKKIIRIFNAESDNAILNLTVKSVNTQRSRIEKSFTTANKVFESENIQLPKKLLESRLEILNLTYTYALKKEEEAEQRRYIKEQLLEEERVRKEIEAEKLKIQKEESQFMNEVKKLMEYMQKTDSDIEKKLYIDKIQELEEKLAALDKDKANVLERETNTRAGFVYVISNIGSLGEDVYKIGMTRRLEPMDRIKELSSASVPFGFDVHALIFSHDAPSLENTLHKEFRNYEVNKVNSRKEFFKIDLNKIEQVVKEYHNATVEFEYFPKAKEYRDSLELMENVQSIS